MDLDNGDGDGGGAPEPHQLRGAPFAEQQRHTALQRMRDTLSRLREGVGSRLGSPFGAAEAGQQEQRLPCATAAAAARPLFSARTRALVGSLQALRAGLQALDQSARRRASELGRDPGAAGIIEWPRSAPPGFASPFPQ